MLRHGLPLFVLALLSYTGKADYMTSPIVAKDDPWRVLVKSLSYRSSTDEQQHVALISIAEQRLYLYIRGRREKEYLISTSRFGAGNREGSYKTPLGLHRVVDKIGANAPLGMIFKARRPTQRIARIYKTKITLPYDLVTTRILRLEGLEPGINKGVGIDTFHRYIYIHGTHEEGMIGQPASIGCVRMRNGDVIKLFDTLPKNALVLIVAGYPENKWVSVH